MKNKTLMIRPGKYTKRIIVALITVLMLSGILPANLPGMSASAAAETYRIGARGAADPYRSSYMIGLTDSSSPRPYSIPMEPSHVSGMSGAPFSVLSGGSLSAKVIEVAYCISYITSIQTSDGLSIHDYVSVDPDTYATSVSGQGTILQNKNKIWSVVNNGFTGNAYGTGRYTDAVTAETLGCYDDALLASVFSARSLSVADLTAQQAIRATQAAVWFFSDVAPGLQATNANGVATDPMVLALYDVLLELANSAPPAIDPVDVRVALDSANAEFNYYDAAGYKVYGPYQAILTSSNGSIQSGSIELTASPAAMFGGGGIWFSLNPDGVGQVTSLTAPNPEPFYIVMPVDIDETTTVGISAKAVTSVILSAGKRQPVVFVPLDSNGRQDFSTSQAIVASVPGSTEITCYAIDALPVDQRVVENNPDLTIDKQWLGDPDDAETFPYPGEWTSFAITITNGGYGSGLSDNAAVTVADVNIEDWYDTFGQDIEFYWDADFENQIIPQDPDNEPGIITVDITFEPGETEVVIYVRVKLKDAADLGFDTDQYDDKEFTNIVVLNGDENNPGETGFHGRRHRPYNPPTVITDDNGDDNDDNDDDDNDNNGGEEENGDNGDNDNNEDDNDGGDNVVIVTQYIPGGNDPELPPLPQIPGAGLVQDGDGWLEIDENGVPLGRWEWDPEPEEWVFMDWDIPLGPAMPRTGDEVAALTLAINIFVLLGSMFAALGLVAYMDRLFRDKKEQ